MSPVAQERRRTLEQLDEADLEQVINAAGDQVARGRERERQREREREREREGTLFYKSEENNNNNNNN